MPDSEDTRTITGYRTASKFYRRPPGAAWLLALLAIPLLLGLIGWAGLNKSDTGDVEPHPAEHQSVGDPDGTQCQRPGCQRPNVNPPDLNFAPLSILRNGNGFTLSGELPSLEAKTGLLDSLRLAFGPDINLTDNLNVKAGVNAPDFAVLGSIFGAAIDIPNFNFDLNGDTLTLKGTAPSEKAKAEVEAAAKAAWPNMKIVNNIEVKGARTDGTACACAGAWWRSVRHAAGRHHRPTADADQLPDRRVQPGAGIAAAVDPDRRQVEGLPGPEGVGGRPHRQQRERRDQHPAQ